MLIECLEEKVVFEFKPLVELLIELDNVCTLIFNDGVDVVDDFSSKLEEGGVELMIGDEDKDASIFDIDFKVRTIGDAAECVAEDATGIVELAVIVEFDEVGFAHVACFAVFRVNKNEGLSVFLDLNVAGVWLITGQTHIGVGEGLKNVLIQQIFGEPSFLGGVAGEVVVEGSEGVIDSVDFVMDGVGVEGGGDVFEHIGLKVGEHLNGVTVDVVKFFRVEVDEFIAKVLEEVFHDGVVVCFGKVVIEFCE